ncbi:MAG: hypothetical protein GXO91_10725 [FCB group bacterium]|nr:hypothetical protein [FCB group bacterium]
MDELYQVIVNNPVIFTIAVILAVIVVLGIIKKLFKLVLAIAAVIILYVAYLQFTGKEVPDSLDELMGGVKDKVETVKKQVQSNAVDKIEEEIKKKANEQIEKAKKNDDI